MDSTLIKYRAFLVAARLGSFTKAGEALGYSQSGISRMIADLEHAWNVKLLERDRGGVSSRRKATSLHRPFRLSSMSMDAYRHASIP